MRPHGYARYKLDGCRCNACGWARSQYETRRAEQVEAGTWQPFVPVGPARAHIEALRGLGYGRRTIAALAGLRSPRQIADIAAGFRHDRGRGNPPLDRIRATTAAAILAVPVTADQLADGALVDAAPTWRRIDDLIARGWTKAAIAREAGLGRTIQLGRDRVTVRNARRVEAAYQRAKRPWGVDVGEVEHLIGTDTPANIAARLGYASAASLARVLHRQGRNDLAVRMERAA